MRHGSLITRGGSWILISAVGASALAGAGVSCSAADGGEVGGAGARQGSGGAGTGGAAVVSEGGIGGIGPLDPDAGTLPSDLPAPWQYKGSDKPAYKDALLPDDVAEKFGGAEQAATTLSIAYPLEASMHPNNLGDVTFHFKRDEALSVFRIEATVDGVVHYFFVPCNTVTRVVERVPTAFPDQCTYTMPESEWLDLGHRYRGREITFTITGSNGTSAIGRSAARTIVFSPEPVLGALYYWSTNSETIMRASMGARKAVPYIRPESAANAFECTGCHTVSRDGRTIAFTVQNENAMGQVDGAAGIQVAPTDNVDAPIRRVTRGVSPSGVAYPRTEGKDEAQNEFGEFSALSPDGKLLAISRPAFAESPVHSLAFEIRDVATGATKEIHGQNEPNPLFGGEEIPIHPEWSPSGDSIAVALSLISDGGWSFFTRTSRLAVLPYSGSLGKPRILVNPASGYYVYYPTWSPDGKWLGFQVAPREKDGNSNDTEKGGIFLVPSSGGPYTCPGDCVELARGQTHTFADGVTRQLGTTWPKFTPFAQGQNGSLMFISYASFNAYGYLTERQTQIWMFAVDVSKVGSGDPSSAPIWLPYQGYDDGSVTPYWTESLPCTKDGETCSGCVSGEICVVVGNNQCECQAVVR